MASEILSKFVLTGTGFDPAIATARLGITPGRTWRAGDAIPNSRLKYEHDGWELRVGPERLDEGQRTNLASQVRALTERLIPATKELLEIIKQFHLFAELSCVLYVCVSDRPAIHFDHDILQWLAKVGAEIDVDLYVLDEQEASRSHKP